MKQFYFKYILVYNYFH